MKGTSTGRIAQAKACFYALGGITTRSQFGGYGILADGIMFAVIAEGELYLRATEGLESVFRSRGMVKWSIWSTPNAGCQLPCAITGWMKPCGETGRS